MTTITTARIDPALVQFLEAMKQGGHDIDLSVITAPDGTRTHSISIRPAAPVPIELPDPQPAKRRPQPQPIQIYCPDCGQCSPSRKAQLTGWRPQRCKKHSRCFQCGSTLTAAERFSCRECNAIGNLGL